MTAIRSARERLTATAAAAVVVSVGVTGAFPSVGSVSVLLLSAISFVSLYVSG